MTASIDILPLLPCLYGTATDAGQWQVFLRELTRCFGGKGAHLMRVNGHDRVLSFSALYGFDDVVLRLYGDGGTGLASAIERFERHFQELLPTDPCARFIERYPNRPVSCRLVVSEADMRASRMYRELRTVADAEYSLAVRVRDDDSQIFLCVMRSRQAPFFNEDEVEAFGELIPHLKQAVALGEHLARVDFARRVALEALDAFPMGVLIVDEHARVVHASAAARRIVEAADGIAFHNNTLRLQAPNEDACLRRAIWDAIANAHADKIPPAQAMPISRRSGQEPYPALIGTLWGNHLRYGLGRLDRPLAVVFVADPEEPPEVPDELLQRLFGLTSTEARLCERLVQGDTVAQTARSLDIAEGTARVHLRNVFDKTGVTRQADLIAKILATPAWLHRRARKTLAP